jgi:hypothetical protein
MRRRSAAAKRSAVRTPGSAEAATGRLERAVARRTGRAAVEEPARLLRIRRTAPFLLRELVGAVEAAVEAAQIEMQQVAAASEEVVAEAAHHRTAAPAAPIRMRPSLRRRLELQAIADSAAPSHGAVEERGPADSSGPS